MMDIISLSWSAAGAVVSAFVLGAAFGWWAAFKFGFPFLIDRLHGQGILDAGPAVRRESEAELNRRFDEALKSNAGRRS